MTSPFIPASGQPVALTVQLRVNDYSSNGSLPTPSIWQQWFNRWWEALSVDELPYLAPVLAIHPKSSIAIALTLQLTTDAAIHQLNRDYRNSDRPTDVLAFSALEALPPSILVAQVTAQREDQDLQSPASLADPIELGDIIVSLDTAQAQAQQMGHSLCLELAWLGAHGLLHLLGWDHPDQSQLRQMFTCQQTLLAAAQLGTINWGAIDIAAMGYS